MEQEQEDFFKGVLPQDDKVYHVLKDGTKSEIVNGRFINPVSGKWEFAPKNKLGALPMNKPYSRVSIIGKQNKINWKSVTVYIENNGMERFVEEMEKLEGRDFITAYLGILPFIKPKIANVEVKKERGDGEGTEKKKGHTITIRDMRDGSETEIQSRDI